MNTPTKKLVIISGVTGAIGSALFAEYGQDPNNVVYGISRKALPITAFLKDGQLPLKTLICSLENQDYSSLFKSVNYKVAEVIYIHALGLYPFEINRAGVVTVENDHNQDGINDEVTQLTLETFISVTTNLQKYWHGKTKCLIFGGIADKHRPTVHQSWWKTIEQVKDYMRKAVESNSNLSMTVFNISSVLCPHEVITRPFVFTNTDAKQEYWLHPYDLAKFVVEQTAKAKPGFCELEKYNIKPDFSPNAYYQDEHFTPRKVKELF